jgi:hypothetical protein
MDSLIQLTEMDDVFVFRAGLIEGGFVVGCIAILVQLWIMMKYATKMKAKDAEIKKKDAELKEKEDLLGEKEAMIKRNDEEIKTLHETVSREQRFHEAFEKRSMETLYKQQMMDEKMYDERLQAQHRFDENEYIRRLAAQEKFFQNLFEQKGLMIMFNGKMPSSGQVQMIEEKVEVKEEVKEEVVVKKEIAPPNAEVKKRKYKIGGM